MDRRPSLHTSTRPRSPAIALSGALLALLLVTTPAFGQADEGIQEITLGASDYAFDWPETIEAGRLAITMENTGQDVHHGFLVKLEEGVTRDEVMPVVDRLLSAEAGGEDATAVEAELNALVDFHGGPGVIVPGASQSLVLDLDPGTYVWFCGLPAADGQPHYAKGMITTFEVVALEGAVEAAEPESDGTLALDDFAYALPASITAGSHLWKITNEGDQPHEFILAQLAPGATAMDFLEVFGDPTATEPPPGLPFGGIGPIEPGETAWLGLDLAPGTYAAFCFITDPGSGQPHLALGMVTEFTVEEAA